jgi:hypothetical protein
MILPLALAMTHLHVLGMTLVAASLLPLLIWRRRTEVVASLAALAAAVPVILPLVDHLKSYRNSDGAAARVSPGYEGVAGLVRGYAEQYSDNLSLAGLLLVSGIAVLVLLASKRRGDRALLIGAATVLGLALVATLAGLTNPRQGQYWLLASLLHAAVLALSIERAGPRLRIVMGVLLLPWLLGAGAQATGHHLRFLPSLGIESRAEYWLIQDEPEVWLGTPDLSPDIGSGTTPLPPKLLRAIHSGISDAVMQSDIILYIDETWWGSDTPRRTDPFFAAFARSDVEAVLPEALPVGAPPRDGFLYPWMIRGRPLQIVTGFPRDISAAKTGPLATELRKQVAAGKSVLVAMVLIDPTDRPPEVATLKAMAEVLEDTRIGPVRLLRLGTSSDAQPHSEADERTSR